MVDKFVIADGQEVTDIESGITYRLRALRGQKFLKPLAINSALSLVGGGATAIPYDTNAEIASTSILRDYIGTEPTDILNGGNPCIIDGVRNTKDTTGCPFIN